MNFALLANLGWSGAILELQIHSILIIDMHISFKFCNVCLHKFYSYILYIANAI